MPRASFDNMNDLTISYDDDNIFAKILRGDAPCIRVDEDDMTLAFMDIMPQTDGHVLVIPKFAATNFLNLTPDYFAAWLTTTQRVARAVQSAFECPGVLIAQLNGAAAGQTVYHVHMHIVPRYAGIDLAFHARDMADMDILEAHAANIRAAL